MNILDTIIQHKLKEVADRKERVSVKSLEESVYFPVKTISLKKALQQGNASGIIAEIKRKSPSQGIINGNVDIETISMGYFHAGASALSILTDHEFFGGSNEDLIRARQITTAPILRKDFIVDEFQLIEAKSLGADVILLIAASLEPKRIQSLAKVARSLGLEVLLEVHDEDELQRNLESGADLMGVNNRNLKTFEVSVNISRQLAELIPSEFAKISESGIDSVDTILELRKSGYQGFLMGQNFMKSEHPERVCADFILELNKRKANEA